MSLAGLAMGSWGSFLLESESSRQESKANGIFGRENLALK